MIYTPEPCSAVQDARCIFAIHNLRHQGVDPAATFPNFGLPDTWSALSCGACGQFPILSPHAHSHLTLLEKASPAGRDLFMTLVQFAWTHTLKEYLPTEL